MTPAMTAVVSIQPKATSRQASHWRPLFDQYHPARCPRPTDGNQEVECVDQGLERDAFTWLHRGRRVATENQGAQQGQCQEPDACQPGPEAIAYGHVEQVPPRPCRQGQGEASVALFDKEHAAGVVVADPPVPARELLVWLRGTPGIPTGPTPGDGPPRPCRAFRPRPLRTGYPGIGWSRR